MVIVILAILILLSAGYFLFSIGTPSVKVNTLATTVTSKVTTSTLFTTVGPGGPNTTTFTLSTTLPTTSVIPHLVLQPSFISQSALTQALGAPFVYVNGPTGHTGHGVLLNFTNNYNSSSAYVSVTLVEYNSSYLAGAVYNQSYNYMLKSAAEHYTGTYKNQSYFILNSTYKTNGLPSNIYIAIGQNHNYVITIYGTEIGKIFGLQQFVNVMNDQMAAMYE